MDLPNEILINILKYLTTYDLIQFCEVFKHLDYFLKEKKFLRITDVSRKYEISNMNFCKFISTNMDPCHIKVLKINGLYWIPIQDLRQLLRKLVNLEELQAVDTKLGFSCKDIVEYFKLRKLAVSVQHSVDVEAITASKSLKSLKTLYMKLPLKGDCNDDSRFLLVWHNISQLEELWVQIDQNPCICMINYDQLGSELPNLKKIVLRKKGRGLLPLPIHSRGETFKILTDNMDTEVILDLVKERKPRVVNSIFDVRATQLEKEWGLFSRSTTMAFGPRESKLISLQEDLHNIQFEDLNFSRVREHCLLFDTKCETALDMLKTNNCKGLKRLSFRSCFFQQNLEEFENPEEVYSVAFKKARIGVTPDSLKHPFEDISKQLKNLRELEIYFCKKCLGGNVIWGYPLIENFEKLQRLSLEVPYLSDGSFLWQVFHKCKQLECLSLKLIGPNENFIHHLCQNLEYATALKDFRFECYDLTIEKVLKSLCKIPIKRLLRLFISCFNINYKNGVDMEIYSKFMMQNPQLILFLLVAQNSPERRNSDIQKTLQMFKRGNPAKIFYVKKKVDTFPEICLIPHAHYDIISNRTRVSVINFDEF